MVFRVGPNNRRSQRALEKLGAKTLGVESDPLRGDSLLYEIRRDTFASV